MFRESDYQYPTLHPTYIKKDVPSLQMNAQLAGFTSAPNSARERCVATTFDPMPIAVPTTYDTFYDPDHPDADWSGFRSVKDAGRKHASGHRSQQVHLIRTERGIIGDSPAGATRKDILPESYVAARAEGPIIGGIGVQGDHYKTTYRSLITHDATQREQLILQKRQLPRKQLNERGDNHIRTGNDVVSPRSEPPKFYRPQGTNLNKSLLANIGSSIMNKV